MFLMFRLLKTDWRLRCRVSINGSMSLKVPEVDMIDFVVRQS